jgi:hypothetical protein
MTIFGSSFLCCTMSGVRFGPQFLKRISEVSRVAFGNRPVVPYRTGFKIFDRIPKGPIAENWYPPDIAKNFRQLVPGFTTEAEDVANARTARLKRKGKGPPKKGEGKRAMKQKSKKGN